MKSSPHPVRKTAALTLECPSFHINTNRAAGDAVVACSLIRLPIKVHLEGSRDAASFPALYHFAYLAILSVVPQLCPCPVFGSDFRKIPFDGAETAASFPAPSLVEFFFNRLATSIRRHKGQGKQLIVCHIGLSSPMSSACFYLVGRPACSFSIPPKHLQLCRHFYRKNLFHRAPKRHPEVEAFIIFHCPVPPCGLGTCQSYPHSIKSTQQFLLSHYSLLFSCITRTSALVTQPHIISAVQFDIYVSKPVRLTALSLRSSSDACSHAVQTAICLLFCKQVVLPKSVKSRTFCCIIPEKGRGIELTKYGQEFYQYVNQALGILEHGIAIMKEKSDLVTGTIDVGCIPTLLGDFLPDALDLYHEKHPQVSFNIFHEKSIPVAEGVSTGNYDIGFCSMVENKPDLVFCSYHLPGTDRYCAK